MTLANEENIPDLIRVFEDHENTKLFWLNLEATPSPEDLAVGIQTFVECNKYYLINYISEVNSFPLMLTWSAYQKDTNQLVGCLSMEVIELKDMEQSFKNLLHAHELETFAHVNFSTIVIPSMQRKGYAMEMGLAFVKNILTYTTANIIVTCSKQENIASLKLIKKYLSIKSRENSDMGQIKIEKRENQTEFMYLYSKEN